MRRTIPRRAPRRARHRFVLTVGLTTLVALATLAITQGRAPRAEAQVEPMARATIAAVVAASAPPDRPAVAAPVPGPIAAPRPALTRPLAATASDGTAVLLAPSDGGDARGAPRVVTMLHGMCSTPDWSCDAVRAAVPGGFVLACPSGNRTCDGAPDWGGAPRERARFVNDHVDEAIAPFDAVAHEGGVLMGFSRGAFVARDVAYESRGRYRALVLIGAATIPDGRRLAANGIEKVVLACGDLDGAKKTMVAARAALEANGVAARFVSLGPVYHTLPNDTAARLRDALAWAAR